jgi:hypothetical protein
MPKSQLIAPNKKNVQFLIEDLKKKAKIIKAFANTSKYKSLE